MIEKERVDELAAKIVDRLSVPMPGCEQEKVIAEILRTDPLLEAARELDKILKRGRQSERLRRLLRDL